MSLVRKLAGTATQGLTKMQVAAIGLFGTAAVGAVVSATFHWWVGSILGLLLVAAILLGVQMYGFSQLTRRMRERLDRVVTSRTAENSPRSEADPDLVADDVLAQWAKSLRTRPGRLNWFIMLARETRSRGARDVLALCATRGRWRYRDLVMMADQTRLRTEAQNGLQQFKHVLWRPGYFALARVLYSQRSSEWDLRDCLTFYELAEAMYGLEDSFDGVDRSFYSDLLTWDMQYSRADEVLNYPEENEWRADSQRFLQLNAVNPNVTGLKYKREEWVGRLNERLAESDLAPLEFPPGEAPSFYNISTSAQPLDQEGLPLVSIIMPIYEPDDATDVAIQSLLNQTWTNIEILVMDDASPTEFKDGTPTPYSEQLRSWAARDSRIRLTLFEENRGAYAVRNDAFAAAAGEYVTVADKDDWHHPQKIERQARELMARPEKNANIVNWVRVDGNLKFLVRWGPDRVVHPSFASIMYRREETQSTLGYWDAVRKSADGEYRTRYEITYGEKLVAEDMVPLAFSLLGEGNLTSTDFGLGYRHPDREIYQDAYTAWHQSLRTGDSAFLPKDNESRKWVGPPSFLPDRDNSQVPHYDVIFVSEFGFWGGNSITLLREIETALGAGLRVGIVPLQNGVVPGAARRRMVPELRSLFLTGRVDRLHLQRNVTTDIVVIHWPAIMQLLPSEPSAIHAKSVIAVANEIPSVLSSVNHGYDVHDVSENCFQTFGTRPYWAPQSEIMREHLVKVIPSSSLGHGLWRGIVASSELPIPRSFADDHVPVIGRPWDEEELNWPADPFERDLVFPKDGSMEVRVRANTTALGRNGVLKSDEAPDSWMIEGFSVSSFEDYLQEIDFLAVYPQEGWDKSVEPGVVEAVNSGVVCIGSPKLEAVFGEAMVYAEPKDFPEMVRFFADSESYNLQTARAISAVQSERSASKYLGLLKEFGAAVCPSTPVS